ncbi:hypothetical protein SNE40_023394 [Patella caerulea]|uniref:Uncharacterized protein n=1 Tax=Patella caerulea TaxID=87958 RepID=A0AAN8IWY7_PATCE
MGILSKSVYFERDIKRFGNQTSLELNALIKSIDQERQQSIRDYNLKMHRFKLKYQGTVQLNNNNKKNQILLRRQTMDSVSDEMGSNLLQESDRNHRRHSIECTSFPDVSGNTTMTKHFTGRHLITSSDTDQPILPSIKEQTPRILDSSGEKTLSSVTKWPDIHTISKKLGHTSKDHPRFGTLLHGCTAVSRRNSEPVVHDVSSDQTKEAKRRLSEDVSLNTVEYKQFDFARWENNWISNIQDKLSVACALRDQQTVVTSLANDLVNKTLQRAAETQTQESQLNPTGERETELNNNHTIDLSNDHERVLPQSKTTSTNDAKEKSDKKTTKKVSSPAVEVRKWQLFGNLKSVKTETNNTKVTDSHNKNKVTDSQNKNKISVQPGGSTPTPAIDVKEESDKETHPKGSRPVKRSKWELEKKVSVKTAINNKVTDSKNKNKVSVKLEGGTSTPTVAVKEESEKETTKNGSRPVEGSKWELLRKLNSVKTETNNKVSDSHNQNKVSVKADRKSLNIFDLSLKLYPELKNTIVEEEGENSECDESNVGIFLTSASKLRRQSDLRQQEVHTMKNLMKFSRGYKRTELVARLLEAEKRASVPVLVDTWKENLSKCRYLR